MHAKRSRHTPAPFFHFLHTPPPSLFPRTCSLPHPRPKWISKGCSTRVRPTKDSTTTRKSPYWHKSSCNNSSSNVGRTCSTLTKTAVTATAAVSTAMRLISIWKKTQRTVQVPRKPKAPHTIDRTNVFGKIATSPSPDDLIWPDTDVSTLVKGNKEKKGLFVPKSVTMIFCHLITRLSLIHTLSLPLG